MNSAAFSLEDYKFTKVEIDYYNKESNDLKIDFDPTGKFYKDNSIFELKFIFSAFGNESKRAFVKIECIAVFKFAENINFDDIPSYFYKNSIAIIFPYIRSFVSTVTLQANIPPIILPTMNLSALEAPLKDSTVQI